MIKADNTVDSDVAAGMTVLHFLNVGNPESHEMEAIGELFAGYFFTYQKFRAALELSADLAKRKVSVTHNINVDYGLVVLHNVSAKLNEFQFNVDLRPGAMVTPSAFLYGIVGAAFTNFDGRGLDRYFVDNNDGEYDVMLKTSASKTVAGLRLGLGLQENIDDSWAVRLQYIYTNYGRVRVVGSGNLDIGDQTALLVDSKKLIKFRNWAATVGIVYQIPNN